MTYLTSISPTNIERQQKAISTWIGEVISINHESEIPELALNFPNVKFIPTAETGIDKFGKHYVKINEFINWVKVNGPGLVINSDIVIENKVNVDLSLDSLLLYSRYDCEGYKYDRAKKFVSGYDAFYLTPHLASLLPPSELCMGQCHWDYFIPYMMIKRNVRLVSPKAPVMFHEVHKTQYSQEMWNKTAVIFSKEIGVTGTPNQVTNRAYELIKSKIRYI